MNSKSMLRNIINKIDDIREDLEKIEIRLANNLENKNGIEFDEEINQYKVQLNNIKQNFMNVSLKENNK